MVVQPRIARPRPSSMRCILSGPTARWIPCSWAPKSRPSNPFNSGWTTKHGNYWIFFGKIYSQNSLEWTFSKSTRFEAEVACRLQVSRTRATSSYTRRGARIPAPGSSKDEHGHLRSHRENFQVKLRSFFTKNYAEQKIPAHSAAESRLLGVVNTSQLLSFRIVVHNKAHDGPKMLLMQLSSLVRDVQNNSWSFLHEIILKIVVKITLFARKPPPSWLFFKLNSRLRSTSW